MKDFFLKLLAVVCFYVFFLLLNSGYLYFRYRKQRTEETKYFTFLMKDEVFRGNIWLLPVVLASVMLHNIFKNDIYYKTIVLVITVALGIYFIVLSFKKPLDESEDEYKDKKLLIGVIVFLFFTLLYFWYKEAVKIFTPLYLTSFLTVLLTIKLGKMVLESRKTGKALKTFDGFYTILGFVVLSVAVLVLHSLL